MIEEGAISADGSASEAAQFYDAGTALRHVSPFQYADEFGIVRQEHASDSALRRSHRQCPILRG